jgi:hypothetical protein
VYNSQVDRLTDIVRTSFDCSSFASINDVVKVSSRLVLKILSALQTTSCEYG